MFVSTRQDKRKGYEAFCSQDRIRTCDIATFITSRVQELMDRGDFWV